MDELKQKRDRARWEWYPPAEPGQDAAVQVWAPIHCARCFGYIDKEEAMRPVFGSTGKYEHAVCLRIREGK